MQLVGASRPLRSARTNLRGLACAILSIVAFLASARLINSWVPPEPDILALKLDELERVPGRFDVVFVGSSHVYQHLNPATFDRVCAEHGVDVRSFNLGMPGWTSLPLAYLTGRVAHSNQPVRYIIVDPEFVYLDIQPENVRTQITIAWHDLQTTVLALNLILASDEPWQAKASMLGRHAIPFLYNLSSYGRAQEGLGRLLTPRNPVVVKGERQDALGAGADGFKSYDMMLDWANADFRAALLLDHDNLLTPQGRKSHANDAAAIAAVGELTEAPSELTRQSLRAIQGRARRAGVAPIFITGPVLDARAELYRARRAHVIDTFLPFNRPQDYPDLYRIENQFDRSHLNAPGAEAYSQRLAEEFVRLLQKWGRLPAGQSPSPAPTLTPSPAPPGPAR